MCIFSLGAFLLIYIRATRAGLLEAGGGAQFLANFSQTSRKLLAGRSEQEPATRGGSARRGGGCAAARAGFRGGAWVLGVVPRLGGDPRRLDGLGAPGSHKEQPAAWPPRAGAYVCSLQRSAACAGVQPWTCANV